MNRLALLLCLATPTLHAATFTVTRFDDPAQDGCAVNGCSLREAATAANATAAADVIVLSSGTYVLNATGAAGSPPTLTFSYPVTVRGNGFGLTFVEPAASAVGALMHGLNANLTVEYLTLRKGRADGTGGYAYGGAILVEGAALVLREARLVSNHATYGGAIHLSNATAEIIASEIYSNSADYGGGVHAWGSPVQLRQGTKFEWNRATFAGGALAINDDLVADTDCELRYNRAARGGAIASSTASSFSVRGLPVGSKPLFKMVDNEADGWEPMWNLPSGTGGAVYAPSGATLERVGLYGNVSNSLGGAVYTRGGAFTLRDSYVTGNEARIGGGVQASNTHPVVIERVGFDLNQATSYGGAVMISGSGTATPASATLRNVDFHENDAPTRGAFSNAANATLTHVTFWRNTQDSGSAALQQDAEGSTILRNSLVLGACVGATQQITAGGTNLRSVHAAGTCPGNATLLPYNLVRGYFGGKFEITGTHDSGSATVGTAYSGYCSSVDIRNRARTIPCDVGAHEYGAQ